jgi:hypothetical protein
VIVRSGGATVVGGARGLVAVVGAFSRDVLLCDESSVVRCGKECVRVCSDAKSRGGVG